VLLNKEKLYPAWENSIEPGWDDPELFRLSEDDHARCLAYLLRHIREIVPVPPDVDFILMGFPYYHGPLHPALGMYSDTGGYTDGELSDLRDDLERRLGDYVKSLGVGELVERSRGETICWKDVLRHYGWDEGEG
jgi:hypothetical protein